MKLVCLFLFTKSLQKTPSSSYVLDGNAISTEGGHGVAEVYATPLPLWFAFLQATQAVLTEEPNDVYCPVPPLWTSWVDLGFL